MFAASFDIVIVFDDFDVVLLFVSSRISQGRSIHRRRHRHNQSPAWAQHPRSSCHRQCIYGRDDPTSRRHLYRSPHRGCMKMATRMSYLDEEAGRSWGASDTCAWCSDGGRSHRTSCTHEILEDIWSWSSSTSSCWPSWAWQSQESSSKQKPKFAS